jgi:hypothetical protein
MLTKQQPGPELVGDNNDHQRVKNQIVAWVLDSLGQPEGLHEVQVRPLWTDHYRVNVLVGPDAASVRVAHSFFLEANREGDIIGSTPTISKQY